MRRLSGRMARYLAASMPVSLLMSAAMTLVGNFDGEARIWNELVPLCALAAVALPLPSGMDET